jgi:hypothetical protein
VEEDTETDICHVWVAEGTYYVWEDDWTNAVQLRQGVAVFGGFTGEESNLEDRDWVANETIVSGFNGPDESHQVFHVVLGANDALIDGLIVADGNAGGEYGAGMRNIGVSPTVVNCVFRNHVADGGNGMFNSENSILLLNSTFIDNPGFGMTNGSAHVFVHGCDFVNNVVGMWNSGGTVTVQSSVFVENTGRGMDNEDNEPLIADCVFHNTGGLSNANASPTISNCIFSNNSSNSDGAALQNRDGSSPLISECVFVGNQAESGGAIANDAESSASSSIEIEDSYLVGNSAETGGALSNGFDSSIAVASSVIVGNSASQGGALYSHSDGTASFVNCTIVENTASSQGGAFYNEPYNTVTVTNSVIWGGAQDIVNDDAVTTVAYSDVEGGHVGDGNIEEDPLFAGFPSVTGSSWTGVSYDADVYQSTLTDSTADWSEGELAGTFVETVTVGGPIWGYVVGNTAMAISVWGDMSDLISASDGYEIYDLHLSAASSCIDAGDGETAPATDIEGNLRVDDPDTPNTGIGPPWADMGAFEYQP